MATTTPRPAKEYVDLDRSLVHREAYNDPEIFQQEMDRIFRSTWLYVGHTSEIPEKHDYKATTFAGQPVIVVRSADGEIRVLANRCRHRGATVCQAKGGNARFFRCEYHGWTYKNDGSLAGVTFADAYADLDKKANGLDRVPRVEEYNGFIFASLNPDVPPLVEHLGAAAAYLDLFVTQGAGHALEARYGTQQIKYRGNWKFQLENGVDGYHPNFVHRSFFQVMGERSGNSKLGSYMDGKAAAVSRDLGNGHCMIDQRATASSHYAERYLASPDVDTIMEELRAALPEDELQALLAKSTSAGFNLSIFPNLQLIGLHIREIVPLSVDETIVKYTPLAVADVPDGINQLRIRNHELFYSAAGFGAPDDAEMFERVSVGLETDTEWLMLARGTTREAAEDGATIAHITDELPQRAQWRHWVTVMDDNSEGTTHAAR